ncbi:tetratricopeptide repeat protein [Desertivirga arenae]|uniref:tetratricopeptide repeat protein n=1 Tax=Desertivirga arenae TaxID=2810309 RepID=UPI001A960232|nr:hypothetical protein [Pedobacter sp. SYSU D00823]
MDIYCTPEERYIQALEELRYGETAKSLQLFNQLLLAESSYARAYYQLGIIHYHYIKDYQAAGYYFEQCIALESNFPDAYQEFIKLLVFLNMPKKAKQIIADALVVRGIDKAFIFEQLGLLEEKNQQWKHALEAFAKAFMYALKKEKADELKETMERVKDKISGTAKFVYSCV